MIFLKGKLGRVLAIIQNCPRNLLRKVAINPIYEGTLLLL